MTAGTDESIDRADDLEGAVRYGLRWSFINTAVARVTSIATGIALARILVPEDYGVLAPALALVNILFGLNDLGMLLALVRWKGDLLVAARTCQSVAMAFSTLLYVACFVGAPAFAQTMGSPESAAVLRVLALTVFIDGITTAAHGLLVRDFRQDRFAKAEFAGIPVTVVVSIGLAVAGAGVWSLVLGQLAANVVSGAMLLHYSPFRVGFGFSWPVARPMLAYGIPLAGTSLVEYTLLNADYLIVSRALDPVAVGIYLLAYNISNWPLSIITDAVRRVSIAGFARLETDVESLTRGFSRAFSAMLTTAFPILVAMGVFALPLVGFVYGDRWTGAAEVLELLLILSAARMAIGFVFDLLVGVGRTWTTFALKCVWLVALVVGLEIGVRTAELRGVAAAHAIVACTVALPLFLRAASRAGADLGDVFRRLRRPIVGLVLSAAVGLTVRDHLGIRPVTVAVGSMIVLVTYLAVVLRRSDVAAARAWVQSKRGMEAAPEPVSG
jgi:O-antigen/teichoic acid export membrane protein